MAKATADCVYYWIGGREVGEWRRAELCPTWLGGTATTVEDLRAEVVRGGRPAVLGARSIGAPEGPPSADHFAEVSRVTGIGWGALEERSQRGC